MIVIRYADDTIVGFQHEHEARAFLDDLKERMRKFELALHPDKTRLIRLGRHVAKQREKLGEGKPETFDFLGFSVLQRHMERRETARRKWCRKAA
jgi:RNA-directed DNA polymerase